MLIPALENLTAAIVKTKPNSIRKEIILPVIDLLAARHVRGGAFVDDVHGFHKELMKVYVDADHPSEKVLVNLARSIQITNAFVENRKSTCMRIDPSVVFNNAAREVPYSTYFMNGPDFSGFHVRFRPVSRGGLRIVTGNQTGATGSSILNECYALAYAQHLKNKDIPESGSKGILLVNHTDKIDKSIMSAVDGLMDCILPHKDVMHVQYRDDIYLGPDEKITPSHIESIVTLAGARGHPAPRTFMTSKVHLGFNHKMLGVTSESVETFLFMTMRKMLFPRTKVFTVKITGGPDGDVAGNMLRILYREYGEWCKIVGIADGTAVCEDPEGIPWLGLLKLVRENKPLSDLEVPSNRPTLMFKKTDTAEHIKARDTMQERVFADVFIPAGGRPFTVNDTNYAEVGKSTKLIVEGANLFITPSARDKITKEFRVPIIKDSSANKGGVCTSSMEVLASMLLLEKEFIKHKDALDDSVKNYVKYLARLEAEAILHHYPARRDLHRVSEEMSAKIIARKDEIYNDLLKKPSEETYRIMDAVVKHHLPPAIVAIGWSRIRTHIPLNYARMMVAASVASHEAYANP